MPTEQIEGRVPVVEIIVTDKVDTGTAARLHARLDDALQVRPVHLIVDVAACSYLDAAGIGVLLAAHRNARRHGAQLVLRDPSPRVRRLLELARVDRVLQLTPPPHARPRPAAGRSHGD
jgi:anti-anti-sigma factor